VNKEKFPLRGFFIIGKRRHKKQSYRLLVIPFILFLVAPISFHCSSAELVTAKFHIQKADWNNAERELQAELVTHPQEEEAWYLLGRVEAAKEKWREMLVAFKNAESIADNYKCETAYLEIEN